MEEVIEHMKFAKLGDRSLESAIKVQGGTQKPKTRLICTLGTSCATVEMISSLLKAGMNVARFNFSHGSVEYHQGVLDKLRQAVKETGIDCAVALDTKGPEVRTGFLENHEPITLEQGSEITLTTDYSIEGSAKLVALSYKKLAESVEPGGKILMADGTVTLTVLSTDESAGTVQAKVENTAKIGERKNCNLPGIKVDLDILTESDKEALEKFAVANKIDFVFASFIQSKEDIQAIRSFMGEGGNDIKIISKIESQLGILNFPEILSATDGIMVARGDLGMEIPLETVFLAQKTMIQMCNNAAKPVVTATQMLESMINNPRPTRAEATDVANAVLDGTDGVMLSGETAGGKFPLEAATTMKNICFEAESCEDNEKIGKKMASLTPQPMSVLESASFSAVKMAEKTHAKLIMVLAASGGTARLIAKYRPSMPVMISVVPMGEARHQLHQEGTTQAQTVAKATLITRGLIPYQVKECSAPASVGMPTVSDAELLDEMASRYSPTFPPSDAARAQFAPSTTESIIYESLAYAKETGLVRENDEVVVVHGMTKNNKKYPVVQVVPCP